MQNRTKKKKNKSNHIIEIIIFSLLFVVIAIVILLLWKDTNLKTMTEEDVIQNLLKDEVDENGFNYTEKKKIDICKTKECELKPLIYSKVSHSSNQKELDKVLEQINKKEEEYYEKTLANSMKKEDCSNEKFQKYNYREYISSGTMNYENKKYISIMYYASKVNVCDDTYEEYPYIIGVYDKEKKRLTTDEELLREYNISKDSIYKKALKDMRLEYSGVTEYPIPEKDSLNYRIYFDSEGNLTANYYLNNNNSIVNMNTIIKEAN